MKEFLIEEILKKLSGIRPIFHSESDFQFALAWKINDMYRDFNIRLEYPMSNNHLDILIFNSETSILFELKIYIEL